MHGTSSNTKWRRAVDFKAKITFLFISLYKPHRCNDGAILTIYKLLSAAIWKK